MSGRRCKVLVVDWNENTLITLQHVLENDGVDTTITWDEAEARQLIKATRFDLLLVGDRLPDLGAETILHDLTANMLSCPCLLLSATSADPVQVRRLGVSGMVSNQDPHAVLEYVRKHWRGAQDHSRHALPAENRCAATSPLGSYRQAA